MEESKDVDISFKNSELEETKNKTEKKDGTPLQNNPFFQPTKKESLTDVSPHLIIKEETPPDLGNRKKIESSPNFMLTKKKLGKSPSGPLQGLCHTKKSEGTPVFQPKHITEIRTVNLNMIINNNQRSPEKQNADSVQPVQALMPIVEDMRSNQTKGQCCNLERDGLSTCKCIII